jgi:hypothetical protein
MTFLHPSASEYKPKAAAYSLATTIPISIKDVHADCFDTGIGDILRSINTHRYTVWPLELCGVRELCGRLCTLIRREVQSMNQSRGEIYAFVAKGSTELLGLDQEIGRGRADVHTRGLHLCIISLCFVVEEADLLA